MRPHERVDAVLSASPGRSANLRGKRSLTIDAGPNEVRNAAGDVVGVEVWVTLRDNGTIVPIDPHRVIVNPPTQVVAAHSPRDGQGRRTGAKTLRSDPEAALWAVLWASVEATLGTPPPAVFRKAGP